MYAEGDDVFYYLTLYNENYPMPEMPEGAQAGILRGLYRFIAAPTEASVRATIIFSGTACLAAREARHELAEHYDVGAELWSATSYKALREEALSTERWNRLHPSQSPRMPWVSEVLSEAEGPCIAVTDYMKAVPDQIARWVPSPFVPLGTDGFGRSDTRVALRRHFETDAAHVVVATLATLASEGQVKGSAVSDAIERYGIDADSADPRLL